MPSCRLTSCCGCWNGSGRSRTASTTEKTAVTPPMATASVSTAVNVKPGDLRSWRRAKRTSASINVLLLVTNQKLRSLCPECVGRLNAADTQGRQGGIYDCDER